MPKMQYSYNVFDICFRRVLCYRNNRMIKQLSTYYPKLNNKGFSEISDFRREADENCALLGY